MLLTPFEIFQAAVYPPLNPHWQPEKSDYCNCTAKADIDSFKSSAQKVVKVKEKGNEKFTLFKPEVKSKVRG